MCLMSAYDMIGLINGRVYRESPVRDSSLRAKILIVDVFEKLDFRKAKINNIFISSNILLKKWDGRKGKKIIL